MMTPAEILRVERIEAELKQLREMRSSINAVSNPFWFGKVTTAAEAATNETDGFTSGEAELYIPERPGSEPPEGFDKKNLKPSGKMLPFINRSMSGSADEGIFYAFFRDFNESVVIIGGSGGGGGGGGCDCTCIANGDIEVSGIITTSRWSIPIPECRFSQTNGTIILPAGTHVVVYDSGLGKWTIDVGDFLTAIYNDGSDATADSTLDGTVSMEWSGGEATVQACVDGTIPEPE